MRILSAALLLHCWCLVAQPSSNSAVPTPKQILGYDLGDRYSTHGGIEQYLFALRDAAKDRIRLVSYGETYEGRKLYVAIISSAENLSRLEEIKSNIHQLADPRAVSPSEADRIIRSSPAIAWLSYGVHGNEASSSEAALNVLYQLLSRNDEEIQLLLKNLVVIIDPLLNPDGHERYVHYEQTREGARPVEDKNAVEHNEDWPSGRTNHYFIDLNRDWAWLTQKESQARIRAYQEWKPQVLADFHEMGYNSSYFFFPSFKPVNKNVPKSTVEWGEIYGKANAAAFDAHGWRYWSGEEFDLFYPGYGDSWPSLNGAIGMTYEQAGNVGLRVRRADETILTLKDRIEHHSATSLATLKATAENRERRLRDFYEFFRDALDEGKSGAIKAFVVNPANDPPRAAKMVALLRNEGIEVHQTEKECSLDNLSTYFSTKTNSKKFPSGSYVIPLYQPSKRLIMALMEQEPALADTFFYDISTWALPVAYGVETYWTGKTISVPMKKIGEVGIPSGSVPGEKASYAYLFKWESNNAMKALVWLLQSDYKAQVAMRGFSVNRDSFSRGTIVVPVHENKPELPERMKELAQKFSLNVFAASSGFTQTGINLGSDRIVRLKKPKIIVVTNSPANSESFGAIWWMFDNEYGIDFVPMKTAQLRNADLHDYTAIVFPDDNSDGHGYQSQIDSNVVQKIRAWISGGGTFVGIEGGAAFASASVGKLATVKFQEAKKDTAGAKAGTLSSEELEKRMTVEEKERKHRLETIPGTMVRVKLDVSHPLGFGYDTSIAVFKTTKTFFTLSEKGYNVGIYAKSPRLSGYMSKENEKKLEDTPFLVHEQLGSGNIILFADDPNFRLFWDSLNKLFLNSVLLMPSIRNVTMTADE